jgi:hypothetical protein
VNRVCVWSNREGSDENSQFVMLSRSTKDPRVISFTSTTTGKGELNALL